jgi:nucleotide-binding universal stress UspA family protein
MEFKRRIKMYKKILVPLDGSEMAECVLAHVEALAKGCQAAAVEFVQVYTPFQIPPSIEPIPLKPAEIARISAQAKATAEEYIGKVVKRFDSGPAKKAGVVLSGAVTETLTDYIAKNNFDLVVMATHGSSGVTRWVWGSVAERLLRASCAPVLMVRAPGCFPGI